MEDNPFSKDEKLFSIVTPIYDVTYQHLPQWADALANQDYKHFEAIVVFDGPHKKGEKMMEKLKKEYPDLDLSYYTIPHAGACAARNFGAEKAKGEYIAFPGGDCYLYPEALRMWATEFEDPSINRVWGIYDLIDEEGNVKHSIGNAPVKPDGSVWYKGFKFSPYSDGTFPVRKSDWIGWDVDAKSLQDWELSIRMLKRDNFEGKDWKYIQHSFFAAELPKKGGLSDDSHNNWQERATYAKSKNGVKNNDVVVASLGAPAHAMNASEILDADYLPMPSFKPHNYKLVYLLGFYTKEGNPPIVTQQHMKTFENNKGVNVIHWIGSDIMQLRWNCSFEKIKALKQFFKDNNVIHLSEAEFTQKELEEVGIKSKVVPLPPEKLYEPMDLPEKFTVGIYAPKSDLYNEELMMEIVRSMPDVQFYFFGDNTNTTKGENWQHLGYIDYDEWIPKFSCNLRVTAHDGLPLTCLQFMSAGRSVVTNVPLKGAIQVEKDRDSIIKGVRKAQKTSQKANVAKYKRFWKKELTREKYIKTIRGLI
jgi:hypothetical protein